MGREDDAQPDSSPDSMADVRIPQEGSSSSGAGGSSSSAGGGSSSSSGGGGGTTFTDIAVSHVSGAFYTQHSLNSNVGAITGPSLDWGAVSADANLAYTGLIASSDDSLSNEFIRVEIDDSVASANGITIPSLYLEEQMGSSSSSGGGGGEPSSSSGGGGGSSSSSGGAGEMSSSSSGGFGSSSSSS